MRESWWYCFCLILILNYNSVTSEDDIISNKDNESQSIKQYISDNGGVLLNSTKEPNGKYRVEVRYDSSCTKSGNDCSTQYFICKFIMTPFGRSWEIIGGTKKCDLISPINNSESNAGNNVEEKESTTWKSAVFGLIHEIQQNDGTASSGEQFVAVRKDPSSVWCADCPTDVDLQASGVTELGNQALQHLNRHHPDVTYSLTANGIIRVQKQAQIINGVRYIVLLEVQAQPNKKDEVENLPGEIKVCQVTFLEKPWVKLPNGNKFRAVLYNNCTEEYSFGDDGEPIQDTVATEGTIGETNIKKEESYNVDATQNRNLTPDQLKNLEEQIIPNSDVEKVSPDIEKNVEPIVQIHHEVQENTPHLNQEINRHDVQHNNIQRVDDVVAPNSIEKSLSNDQKQALEMILSLFGFDPLPTNQQNDLGDNSFMPDLNVGNNYAEDTQILVNRRKREVSKTDEIRFIQELANYATKTIDMYDDDNLKRVVLDIVDYKKVKKDSSSVSYLIKAQVGFSVCEESSESNDCDKMLLNNIIKICNIQVDVGKNGEKSIAKSHCHNYKHKRSGKNWNIENKIDQPETNAKVIEVVHKSLRQYEENVCSDNFYDVVHINLAIRDVTDVIQWLVSYMVIESPCCVGETCSVIKSKYIKTCEAYANESTVGEIKIDQVKCFKLPIELSQYREISGQHNNINLKYVPSIVGIALDNIDLSIDNRNRLIDLPIDHPDVVEIAARSLRHYEINICSAHRHSIYKILKSNLRILNGNRTINVEFTIDKVENCQKPIELKECDDFDSDCHLKMCLANFTVSDNKIHISCHQVPKKNNLVDDSWQNIPVDEFNIVFLTGIAIAKFNKETRLTHELQQIHSASANDHLIKLHYNVISTACNSRDIDCKETTYECNSLIQQGKKSFTFAHIDNYCLDTKMKKDLDDEYLSTKFQKFKSDFKKVYDTNLEHEYRAQIFAANLDKINELNNNEQGTAVYGVTEYTDLPYFEFRNKYTGYLKSEKHENDLGMPNADIPSVKDLPTEYDWRTKGAVTEVKNQGQCGSCWAFSITGNVEGLYKIKTGTLLSLSEQELVDCDKIDKGCGGGEFDSAYTAIEQLGGLELEQDYPYSAEEQTCHFNKSIAKVRITGAVNISSDEVEMQKWLYTNGPMSIALNANAMQFYYGGISHPFKFLCNPNDLDHGVLIVGWGIHHYPLFNRTMPFWIVKNSWGPLWGEQGYYRVYRGDGTCGLNRDVASAVL